LKTVIEGISKEEQLKLCKLIQEGKSNN